MFQLNYYLADRALSFRRNRRNRTDHISRIRLHFRIAGIVARKWRTHSSHLLPRVRSTILAAAAAAAIAYPTTPYCANPSARCRGHCQFPWQITFQYHVPFFPPPLGAGGRQTERVARSAHLHVSRADKTNFEPPDEIRRTGREFVIR